MFFFKNWLYAANNGKLFRSDDGGATWQEVDQGLENLDACKAYPETTANTLYLVAGYDLFFTTDGVTWQKTTRIPSDYSLFSFYVTEDDTTIYAVDGMQQVFISRDQGQTWEKMSSNPPPMGAHPVLFMSNNKLFMADSSYTEQGIYYYDSTRGWINYTGSLQGTVILSQATIGDKLYVLSQDALHRGD